MINPAETILTAIGPTLIATLIATSDMTRTDKGRILAGLAPEITRPLHTPLAVLAEPEALVVAAKVMAVF